MVVDNFINSPHTFGIEQSFLFRKIGYAIFGALIRIDHVNNQTSCLDSSFEFD